MKKIILLLCIVALVSCKKKELTFEEYYDCNEPYQTAVSDAAKQLANHQITTNQYNTKVADAKATMDACIQSGKDSK